ncbi:MAG: YbaB/EbfC family nucleoid-associated protein [Sphaerochaetaceae bacterium]|jgi:DNA-binding YbaB/EbfC family protein|nr:YbaB/EbfC family nucleoid-associated protein [Sphaerochaetaceae bacterium]
MNNPFEMLSNLQGLTQKAEELKSRMKEIKVTGSSGAGLVEVCINGDYEVLSIKIDPVLMKSDQAATTEVLIASAFNTASSSMKARLQSEMASLYSGFAQ